MYCRFPFFLSFSPESHYKLLQVDEMYRAGVKPWNSSDWKPRLGEEAHKNALKSLHQEQDDSEEKRTSQGS